MKLLDWSWYIDIKKDLSGIPTVKTLIESAKELCLNAYNNNNCCCSGGFVANYSDEILELSFVLEEWTAE